MMSLLWAGFDLFSGVGILFLEIPNKYQSTRFRLYQYSLGFQ